jgi:dolichol-phosphate mannosyltransferase
MISVVIPTYNEAAVIEQTLRRAAAALRDAHEEFELIVVDDSSADGTAKIAESLGGEIPVRVLRRPGRRGLATAVLDGWGMARGDLLAVMDADLQHPPEILRPLAEALRQSDTDLALASRYVSGGGATGWSWTRRFISWGATHLASSVLPLTLAGVSDPLSGMFALRRSVLDGAQLNPLGYKILLEVLAKGRYRKFVEVSYILEPRGHGTSKLGLRQSVEYLLHLGRLARSTGQLAAWVRYGLVGLSGAIVNIGAVYLLTEAFGWRLLAALPVAIQLALLNNFFWNENLTFRGVPPADEARNAIFIRLVRYEIVCLSGALLNAGVTLILADHGLPVALAAAGGVMAGGIWNFLLNVPAIWRVWGKSRPRPA